MATSETSGKSNPRAADGTDQAVKICPTGVCAGLQPAPARQCPNGCAARAIRRRPGRRLNPRRFLGQRGDRHPLAARGPELDFLHEVNLAGQGPHFAGRVQQPRRPDDLPRRRRRCAFAFEICPEWPKQRSSGLSPPGIRRNSAAGYPWPTAAESMVHQDLFPRLVPVVHPAHLGERHMRLVHDGLNSELK